MGCSAKHVGCASLVPGTKEDASVVPEMEDDSVVLEMGMVPDWYQNWGMLPV